MTAMRDRLENGRSPAPADFLAGAARPALAKIRSDQGRVSFKLVRLLQHIESHLFDPTLNIASLRKACRIRDNSVVIQFHLEVGLPPKAYLSHRRLETAARLLHQSDLRVWQIADLTGYSGLGVFSKAFSRWAGQRPNAFRRQMRGIDQREDPSDLVSPSLLQRAVAGELSTSDAKWLIEKLLEVYPDAKEAGAVEEKGN